MQTTIVPHEDTIPEVRKERKWVQAFWQILPIFVGVHLIFLFLTILANLFVIPPESSMISRLPLNGMWGLWNRWDAEHFLFIARNGYDETWRTAFFPLFPLLIHGVNLVVPSSILSGLIVANLATLATMVVFYQLVKEELGPDVGKRAVLYLSLFPTAFFLSAIYNESLFLFLTLCFFYQLRHQRWWLAGLFGLLATLTRSSGILLLAPFFWEFLRRADVIQDLWQRRFPRRIFHWGILASILIPVGLGLFALYSYWRFGDCLAFFHAQEKWTRVATFPLVTPIISFLEFMDMRYGFNVLNVHDLIDLIIVIPAAILLILSFIGPWKLGRERMVYGVYGVLMFLFFLSVPVMGGDAMQSLPRFSLELFPLFMVLALIGGKKQVNQWYLIGSAMFLATLLLLFLSGHWMT